jgi:hypothetical protein
MANIFITAITAHRKKPDQGFKLNVKRGIFAKCIKGLLLGERLRVDVTARTVSSRRQALAQRVSLLVPGICKGGCNGAKTWLELYMVSLLIVSRWLAFEEGDDSGGGGG